MSPRSIKEVHVVSAARQPERCTCTVVSGLCEKRTSELFRSVASFPDPKHRACAVHSREAEAQGMSELQSRSYTGTRSFTRIQKASC